MEIQLEFTAICRGLALTNPLATAYLNQVLHKNVSKAKSWQQNFAQTAANSCVSAAIARIAIAADIPDLPAAPSSTDRASRFAITSLQRQPPTFPPLIAAGISHNLQMSFIAL
jgi:hypothetical protein